MRRSQVQNLAFAAVVLLAGCATPGPPLPPSLELPRPVMDLEATREGNRVLLTWTSPAETTDKLRIRHPGPTAICRKIEADLSAALQPAPAEAKSSCDNPVATVPASQLQPITAPQKPVTTPIAGAAPISRVSYSVEIPAELILQYPDSAAVFYVEPLNSRGHGAGHSNAAGVPLAPSFAPPADFRAEQTKTAIVLSWSPLRHAVDRARLTAYRIERSEVGAQTTPDERLLVAAGSASDGRVSDTQFNWDKQYRYRIAAVTGVFAADGKQITEVQGEWSQPVELATRDVFPPAEPAGVQAVFTQAGDQRFIDLTWMPNTEADLAGYFVYRRTEGTEPQRLNSEPLKSPAFRDTKVVAGARYFYSVSAVDLRGNESPRSPEASEAVPSP
ncbi:MAG TPA: hypothetical protein VKB56_08430 [Terriglobales bacterium]|nr:hypothetical protein [Terriglobales bacterium]